MSLFDDIEQSRAQQQGQRQKNFFGASI